MNTHPTNNTARSSKHQRSRSHPRPCFSCKITLCCFQLHPLRSARAWAPSTTPREARTPFRKIISVGTRNREIFVSFTITYMYRYFVRPLPSQQRSSIQFLPLGLSIFVGEDLCMTRESNYPIQNISPFRTTVFSYEEQMSKPNKSIQP